MKVTREIDTGDEKFVIRQITTSPKEHFEGRGKSGRMYPLYSVVVNNGTTFVSQNGKMKEEPYVIYDAEKEEFKAPDGWKIKEMSADSRVTALGGGGGGVTLEEVEDLLSDKVDKVDGKGLSTNDYDNTEKGKVASAYQKPNNGIPMSDLSQTVQSAIDNAGGAYKKPSTGIPFTDLASGVQDSLSNADSAIQPGGLKTINNTSIVGSGNIDIPPGQDGADGVDGVGFASVSTPSTADGTALITLTNGDTITLDLNHQHTQYPKYVYCATQAAYDAITTKESDTLYLILESN